VNGGDVGLGGEVGEWRDDFIAGGEFVAGWWKAIQSLRPSGFTPAFGRVEPTHRKMRDEWDTRWRGS
jgi:hypothetical protein